VHCTVCSDHSARQIACDDNPLFRNIIDARQPGIGKTEDLVEHVAANPHKRYLIIANTHMVLEEMVTRVHAINPEVRCQIIKGFSKACPKYDEVKDLHEKGVHARTICTRMNCANSPGRPCTYRTQWDIWNEDGNIICNVLIPINMVHIFDFADFDEAIIEESTSTNGYYEYEFNRQDIITDLSLLVGFGKLSMKDLVRLVKAMSEGDVKTIRGMEPMLTEAINAHNTHISMKYQKNKHMFLNCVVKSRIPSVVMYMDLMAAMKSAKVVEIEKKSAASIEYSHKCIEQELADIEFHEDVTPQEIAEFKAKFKAEFRIPLLGTIDEIERSKDASIQRIEKNKKEDYLKTSWQNIIFYKQLQAGCDVYYNNTIFPERLFLSQLQQFQAMFPEYRQESIIYETFHTNKNSTIEFRTNTGFYKTHILKQFKDHYKKIKDKVRYHKKKGQKVAIVTFKVIVDKGKGKFCGADAFYYGSFGGVNTFRDYDVLIVIGTLIPPEEWYQEKWDAMYPGEDMPPIMYDKSDPEYMVPENERLMLLFEELWLPEVYNIIHRVRPLQHNVKIFWYGKNIPPKLRSELKLKNAGKT
jgi:hypothetical protein